MAESGNKSHLPDLVYCKFPSHINIRNTSRSDRRSFPLFSRRRIQVHSLSSSAAHWYINQRTPNMCLIRSWLKAITRRQSQSPQSVATSHSEVRPPVSQEAPSSNTFHRVRRVNINGGIFITVIMSKFCLFILIALLTNIQQCHLRHQLVQLMKVRALQQVGLQQTMARQAEEGYAQL